LQLEIIVSNATPRVLLLTLTQLLSFENSFYHGWAVIFGKLKGFLYQIRQKKCFIRKLIAT